MEANYPRSDNQAYSNEPRVPENDVLNKSRAKLRLDALERIQKSAYSYLINSQQKLIKIIESLNSEFIKISEYLEDLFKVVYDKERLDEVLSKKIKEFDTRAENKNCIELRKYIKSELIQFSKSFQMSKTNPQLVPQPPIREAQRKSYNDKNKNYEPSGKSSRDPVETRIVELQQKHNINDLKNELTKYLKFFSYYRKSSFNLIPTVIFALYKSCFKYIENSTDFSSVFKTLLSKFSVSNEEIDQIMSNILTIQQNPLNLIFSSLQKSETLKIDSFTDIAGIFVYSAYHSKMKFIGNEDNSLYIFLYLEPDDTYKILLPKKREYKKIRDLWLILFYYSKFS